MKTYFTLRGGFRNWFARLLLKAANKIAKDDTMFDVKDKWKFWRKVEPAPYPGVPQSRFNRPNSSIEHFGY